MTTPVVTETAKTRLIEAIKSELANSSDEQNDVAVYGRTGVNNMTKDQLISECYTFAIDPFEE